MTEFMPNFTFIPTVYLAGPIEHCTHEEIWVWRQKATALLEPLHCLNPARRSYSASELALPMISKNIVTRDKADIAASNAVLAYYKVPAAGSRMTGTTMEIIYAAEHGKLVVVVSPYDDLSSWIDYHAHYITKHLEDACNYIKRFWPH